MTFCHLTYINLLPLRISINFNPHSLCNPPIHLSLSLLPPFTMSDSFDFEKIKAAAAKYPKPASSTYAYGTAGFRMKADILESVMFRVGLLAVLRSKKLDGQVIGIMITASHNPEEDNGVKLIDPRGEMLEQSWESYATSLANASTEDELVSALQNVIATTKIDLAKPSSVIFGRDTRPSGPALVAALVAALDSVYVKYVNHGFKTTPQLHYIVRCINTQGTNDPYGEPTEEGYYQKLATAFKQVVNGKQRLSTFKVDCANGIGAPKLKELCKHIEEDLLSVEIINDDINTKGALNFNCGADFVKTKQRLPYGLENLTPDNRAASYDGDADRIVYYYVDTDRTFKLLDGDKIAGLAAMFIMDLVKAASVEGIQVGVVQTAYANGSSTNYLTKSLKIPVSCVATGVKHLHHEAEKYDIGVYFEANGHGTVLFSPEALQNINSANEKSPAQATALRQLRGLTNLINQTVGDAISDMLLVEAILTHRRWSPRDWDAAYTDLPNRLVKVIVANRFIFKTTDAERKLVEPKGLQEDIDALTGKYTQGRAFVRPSGTEDGVRVYAEAATRKECDDLAFSVAGLIFDRAGGVGGKPKDFL